MTTPRFGRPLTRADLDALPDDGHRHESSTGSLIVSPASRWQHQPVVGNLYLVLRAGCPVELYVTLAPFAVALAEDTEVQPDRLVTPRAHDTGRELPGAPLLADRARASGHEAAELTQPFFVRIVPAELVA